MNFLRSSVTTILQHRTHGCSNGCSSLACTILYIVKSFPLFIFLKCGWNNLNSYNSKTHVVRTNFESPWGFELLSATVFMKQRWLTAQLRLHKNLLSKFNLRACSINWSSGENHYGKTNAKKKNFVKRSQQSLNSTRKFCLHSTNTQQKIFFFMINKNTLDNI